VLQWMPALLTVVEVGGASRCWVLPHPASSVFMLPGWPYYTLA